MTQRMVYDLLVSATTAGRDSLVGTREHLTGAALPEHKDLVRRVFSEICEHNQAALPDHVAFFAIACGNRSGTALPDLEPELLNRSGTLSDR